VDAPSLTDLSKAAGVTDREGLTGAGRALQKHGGRSGSVFPVAKGTRSQINAVGQQVADDILTDPAATMTRRHHARFGEVIEVRAPDGRGVRYDAHGNFIGFLEP
jgi:filamentous hemagglutinin